MVHFRQLLRNGSSVCVTIPVSYLQHLGWAPGRQIAVELLQDNTVWLRVPTSRDYAQRSVEPRNGPALPLVAR